MLGMLSINNGTASGLHLNAGVLSGNQLTRFLGISRGSQGRKIMEKKAADARDSKGMTREKLVDLLNEDLEREYQAIISYVVYSQVLKGAQYMNIAAELEVHAGEELQHAITLANQIDYLGGMPRVTPKPVKTSEKAEDMLRFDLDNENETIRNYRRRVAQCECAGRVCDRRAYPGHSHSRARSSNRPGHRSGG